MNLEDLTPEQKAKLHAEFLEEQKLKAEKIKQTKATYKELAEEFVKLHIDELVSHREITEFIIEKTMEDFADVKELKQEVYGVKEQDSHTVTLKDGSASITLGQNVIIRFDGTETAGVEKIKEYLKSLAKGGDEAEKLALALNAKLKANKKTGFLNPSSLIEFNEFRERFNSELFSDGLDIITNAQIRTVNSMYVSGWKFIPVKNGQTKKLEFRFTI